MKVNGITPNLRVADIAGAREFYADYLGLTPGFDLGWVANFQATDNPAATVQLVTEDATAPEDSVISIGVSDVDEAYAEAQRRGYDIVHPLTREPWGVRRFFVRAPGGAVINILAHD
jgi:catechol 2,3-dioxygenase-like lactoylglutathione lyase family enzyme